MDVDGVGVGEWSVSVTVVGLVEEGDSLLGFAGGKQTDRQTDRPTDSRNGQSCELSTVRLNQAPRHAGHQS